MNRASSRHLASSGETCIIGTGMVTAVGYNSPMTTASVRAGLSRFKESRFIDRVGEPILLSPAEFIDDNLHGLNRLLALAVPAANEAVAPLLMNGASQKALPHVPICLGISASRPGFDADLEHGILPRLENEAGMVFSKTERFVIPTGHASGLMGIEKAVQLIASGRVEFMLVGGVDSYYDPITLEWLDENKRLHSEENKDGFIPGEGAGFCLVASINFARRYGLKPLAVVLSAASEEEPNPLTSDGICIGEGLTKVLRQVLAVLTDEKTVADWTISDMNGESFRAGEWMYAYLRTGHAHRSPLEVWHPADCWGDVGAASGPLLMATAIQALRKGYARGSRPLVWCSSDAGPRAAVLLTSSAGGG